VEAVCTKMVKSGKILGTLIKRVRDEISEQKKEKFQSSFSL